MMKMEPHVKHVGEDTSLQSSMFVARLISMKLDLVEQSQCVKTLLLFHPACMSFSYVITERCYHWQGSRKIEFTGGAQLNICRP